MELYGREDLYRRLLHAFGVSGGSFPKLALPSALYLWGMGATGKSFILNKAIEASGINQSARISASEVMCGKRPFFETLLRQLDPSPSSTSDTKCDNPRIFIRQLVGLLDGNRVVIILDEAEYLRKEYPELLDIFLNLQELTQKNICVVVTTYLPPSAFCSIPGMRSIPTLHFPQYSKDEMFTIITNCYAPAVQEVDVFKFYVKMVLDVFYQNCRDLKKLLRLTKSNWEYFYRYASTGSGSSSSNSSSGNKLGNNSTTQGLLKLWKNMEPRLKEEFKALSSNVLPMGDSSSYSGTTTTKSVRGAPPATSDNDKNYADIPKYTKFLLIASYLATHNPPASDKRFFVKAGMRGTKKTNKYNIGGGLNRVSEMDSADKTNLLRTFDLNRLKAICAFIVHYCSGGTEHFQPNADVLMQISTLCHAKFLQSLGEDASGNFKYRCLADFHFINELAKSENFELEKYLFRLL
jgi:origin recognition complex subunit 5